MISMYLQALTFCCLTRKGSYHYSKSKAQLNSSSSMDAPSSSSRIAVVGDVHDHWSLEEDSKALQLLQDPIGGSTVIGAYSHLDVTETHVHVFSPFKRMHEGDFGEENVELVRSVASLKFHKAVILGNHDSWYTHKFSGREKDGVQLQLECLGEEHVGYRRLDFPAIKVSVVGGRPFSCGGKTLYRKKLLSARYGIENMDASAKRINKAAMDAPEDHAVLFLAHNGPSGLGSNLNDICGKDWLFDGGDNGDPDLAQSISQFRDARKYSVPLVVFGHMHKELAYGKGLRKMIVVGPDDTIYLNAAVVPRVKTLIRETSASNSSSESTATTPSPLVGTVRAFTVVEISDGKVSKITETWVSIVGDKTKVEEEQVLFQLQHS